jgi:hypothetical protein
MHLDILFAPQGVGLVVVVVLVVVVKKRGSRRDFWLVAHVAHVTTL